MKQVTLVEAMRGVGDRPVLPDAVADRLVAEGKASSAETWPATTPAKRQVLKPARPAGAPDQRRAR